MSSQLFEIKSRRLLAEAYVREASLLECGAGTSREEAERVAAALAAECGAGLLLLSLADTRRCQHQHPKPPLRQVVVGEQPLPREAPRPSEDELKGDRQH